MKFYSRLFTHVGAALLITWDDNVLAWGPTAALVAVLGRVGAVATVHRRLFQGDPTQFDVADFLRDLRHRLPVDLKLSITGLMDWSSNADPTAIAQLKGVVDEVVVQTYQGRHSIPDYAAYLPRMNRLGLPFKVGLIQGGVWEAPGYLKGNEWFRGYVVFLQNP